MVIAQPTIDAIIAARIAAEVEKLKRGDEWIDQTASPLGKRQHLALVKAGVLSGSRVGKRVLVRRSHIDAFIESQAVTAPKAATAAANDGGDTIDATLAELGFSPRKAVR